MNPQQLQSIKLMELPSLDLRDKIQEELEKNPALEILEDKTTISLERSLPDIKSLFSKGAREQAANEYRQFIEGTLTRSETLQEHLLWQLQLEPVNDDIRRIAETLIQNLDDDGFHIEDPVTLFNAEKTANENDIEKAMSLIQKMEPSGCCTRDFKESLKVQIKLEPHFLPEPIGENVIEIILENLDLIEKEKYSILSKKTGLDEEDIHDICELIKTLSPFPGRSFASAAGDIQYVIPDINVEKKKNDEGEDELFINLNDEAFPVLGVNKFYDDLIGNDKNNKKKTYEQNEEYLKAREFAKENIKEARLFIDHLKRRNQTLIRVANAILQFQRAFFFKGPKYLVPLTQKDIAMELDVHETTISRVANGKYMQTEWGIFEIKYFFTNSIAKTGNLSSENARFSKESVKEIIKEIISAENGRIAQGGNKLSDNEISALLAQRGIALARRTVAKYRKELDMGSSYTRRSYDRK